jgi:murein DD-endopeptidase MepM/ murein hydrolase activator NlpD
VTLEVIEMSKRGSVINARRIARIALALSAGVVASGAAGQAAYTAARSSADATSYQWPLKPFHRAHPVRASFGDPRTLFSHGAHGDALAGSGTFSFHNGIDIDAPNGAAVYAVESGVVRTVRSGYSVCERTADGRSFVYTHISPLVRPGQSVTAGVTVLGRVKIWNEHLHFSEFSANGGAVDPLLSGHLTPYRDTTRPVVAALEVRAGGRIVPPFELRGRVALIADAFDPTMPIGQVPFAVTRFARDGFPVAPASVSWSLSTLQGETLVRGTAFDFRGGIPSRAAFWTVYARGTYQNRPPIFPRYHKEMPGRFLFGLTRDLDTRKLRDGVYVVTITAVDARSNAGRLETRIEIRNHDRLTRVAK